MGAHVYSSGLNSYYGVRFCRFSLRGFVKPSKSVIDTASSRLPVYTYARRVFSWSDIRWRTVVGGSPVFCFLEAMQVEGEQLTLQI